MKHRIHKTKNYTVMSNHHLLNPKLSMKAKGLLSIFLALPDDWKYTLDGLVSMSKESLRAVKSALNELKENGYIVVTKLFPNETESHKIEYVYDIYEEPQPIQKQGIQNVAVEKDTLQNTKELNTKEQNDKIDKIDKRLTPSFDAHEKESSLKTDKPNALSQILVDEKYIKKNDAYMDEYNSFIEKKVKEYGYEKVRSAVRYFATQFRRRHGRDEYGLQVDNRLAYFIQSISNGLMRMATDADIHEEMVKMMEEYDSDLKGA